MTPAEVSCGGFADPSTQHYTHFPKLFSAKLKQEMHNGMQIQLRDAEEGGGQGLALCKAAPSCLLVDSFTL